MGGGSGWRLLLLALVTIKLIAALAGFLVPSATTAVLSPFPVWIHGIQIVAFGGAGALLWFGGRRDTRAIYLALAYLLFASVFADRLIFRLATAVDPPWTDVLLMLRAVRLDAFTAAFWWLFFRDFPSAAPFGRASRLPRIAIPVSLAVGFILFGVNLAGRFRITPLPVLLADVPESHYWTLLIALTLPAFLFALWKARDARLEESRRVRLFVAGLAAGSLPMLAEVLVESFVPPFREWMDRPTRRQVAGLILYPLLLSIPFTTAYSVLVDQVLDVRLVVRRAIRYALARYTVMAMLSVPFVALIAYLYEHRGESIAALFAGGRPFLLLAAVLAGLAMLRQRHRVFTAIDRRFFREQYDTRRILTELTESSRRAATSQELSSMIVTRVEASLHLDSIAMLLADTRTGQLVSEPRSIRPLSLSSALAALAAGDVQPFDIDLEVGRSPLRRLPEEERQWLADGGFRLLLPFLASDGSLLGLLALGEKKSDLPFDAEDRALLAAVAAASAATLENRLLRESPAGRWTPSGVPGGPAPAQSESEAEVLAGECKACGTVYQHTVGQCVICGGAIAAASIPYVLSGKFRFDRRVGQGGMGVVYRATDLVLQRTVAIKTLPRISPEAALRLRREARAAARVVHRGLAQIFGAETWRGTPMLIFEFLEAGTLADRIAVRPLSAVETVHLGVSVADVLDRAHAAGILHGDIKPSNIGYRVDGSVAVLDFGVARMMGRAETVIPIVPSMMADVSDRTTGFHLVPGDAVVELKGLAGTLAYVAPEALSGAPADPSFDLWSLAVVLYEALTGANPFDDGAHSEISARIRAVRLTPLRDACPQCPAALASLVDQALDSDRRRRPATAREFASLLRRATAAYSGPSD